MKEEKDCSFEIHNSSFIMKKSQRFKLAFFNDMFAAFMR